MEIVNIQTAMNHLSRLVKNKGLEFDPDLEDLSDWLLAKEFFGFNDKQLIVFSGIIACDTCFEEIEVSAIIEYLGCNKSHTYALTEIFLELEKRNLIILHRIHFRKKTQQFKTLEIKHSTYEALYKNENRKIKTRTEPADFMEALEELTERIKEEHFEREDLNDWIEDFFKRFENHPTVISSKGLGLDIDETLILFNLILEGFVMGMPKPLNLSTVLNENISSSKSKSILRKRFFYNETLLQTKGIVEAAPAEFRDGLEITLTTYGFNLLIPEEYQIKNRRKFKPFFCDLLQPADIADKQLFYNAEDETVINELFTIIRNEELSKIYKRLDEIGMRKGISILLYGPPGTGKTETVLQLAKTNQRPLLMVDISKIKSMWVGETEKNLKRVFDEYRTACQCFEQTPILLFNESDALINKRINVSTSTDTMQNSMQNILLQQLENFEGIFIATTNLLQNLDPAFNRRFLYKVELKTPTVETRAKIIGYYFNYLSSHDCEKLAQEFTLSGGQLENIKRKAEMQFIIHGNLPDANSIAQMAREEIVQKNQQRTVIKGFVA